MLHYVMLCYVAVPKQCKSVSISSWLALQNQHACWMADGFQCWTHTLLIPQNIAKVISQMLFLQAWQKIEHIMSEVASGSVITL
jgi:hypothetical protein